MLSLDYFAVYVPDKKIAIADLQSETHLSREMLSIFNVFYGLRSIAVYENGGVVSLIEKSVLQLKISHIDFRQINYLLYLHTADWVLPYGDSVLTQVQEKFDLQHCKAFEVSFARCASYFLALELLQKIACVNINTLALVITGEIAFTPALRVVPRSTLVSDASTAALWSFSSNHHVLLSVVNRFFKGYEKGIYLSSYELENFDKQFIENFSMIIQEAVFLAKIELFQIKLILPHNVNMQTWAKIADHLYFPLDKIYLKNIAILAHAFCSDHLINLQSAMQENLLKAGDYYVMAGCGLGFYISAAVFRV